MQTPLSTQAIQPAAAVNADMFTRWTSYLDAAPKTVETYTKAVGRFFSFLYREGIAQPSRADVLAYREELKQAHKPTTVQAYITAVKLFFKWAAQEGRYQDIAAHIKGAKLDKEHKKDYLTPKQAAALLTGIDRTSLKGKRDYAMLALMLTTGLRTISIIRASVEDIKPYGDTSALYYQGKGHMEKAELVKLADHVELAIRDYLQARGTVPGSAPLFASISNRDTGARMTTRSISRVAKDRLIAAGLSSDRLTAHSLRHTAATLNLLAGGSVEETQQLLGHKSIGTTMIYSHALKRANNHSEARIAAAIFA